MTKQVTRDILEWDVASWRHALDLWERHIPERLDNAEVLDLGARRGGLSLYFALKGARVTCSDYRGPKPEAKQLHTRYGLCDRITYADINATAIDLPDNTFDFVAFKSILGGIGGSGGHHDFNRQQQVMREIHRVLKPGGCLCFAENLTASALHRWMRRRFVHGARRWRYISPDEMVQLVGNFERVELDYWGFWATFGRSEQQRRLLHAVDVMTRPFIPRRSRYIAFGCCWK